MVNFHIFGTDESTAQFSQSSEVGTPRRHFVLVGHGPSNNRESRDSVLKYLRRNTRTLLVLTRDACDFDLETELFPIASRVVIVNCDINDEVDRPFLPERFRNLFLFYSLRQKVLAEQRGWEEFACIPPTTTFFTGLCALLWIVSNNLSMGVICIGQDLNFNYVWEAHHRCRQAGIFASADREVTEKTLIMSCVQILQAYIQCKVAFATNSDDFLVLMNTAKEVIADKDKIKEFFEQHDQACKRMLEEADVFQSQLKTQTNAPQRPDAAPDTSPISTPQGSPPDR